MKRRNGNWVDEKVKRVRLCGVVVVYFESIRITKYSLSRILLRKKVDLFRSNTLVYMTGKLSNMATDGVSLGQ